VKLAPWLACLLLVPDAARDERTLLAAYRTSPQGYPSGQDERGVPYARPDASAFFRWHFYNDTVPRAEDAAMKVHVQPYNPLEGEGVAVPDKHAAKFGFVAEHATSGMRALRVDFDAAAMAAGRAALLIHETVGPSFCPGYAPTRHHVAAYWCHYRWAKLDVFNPSDAPVRMSFSRVPIVLPPGPSVVAVKTADAVGWANNACAIQTSIELRPLSAPGPVTLYIDHVRVEQELPRTLSEKGRLFAFPPRTNEQKKRGVPVIWPGFTAVERDTQYDPATGFGWTRPSTAPNARFYEEATFRSVDNAFVWGRVTRVDAPLRVDLPKGRYGVWFLPFAGAGWAELDHADQELSLTVNGVSLPIRPTLKGEERHRQAFAGEAWDWRPGSSLWHELVWPLSAGADPVHYVDNTEGHLTFEFPWARALILFAEEDKAAAPREIARLKYLLCESWDVSHAWVKGPYAEAKGYLGAHAEATTPDIIPGKVKALGLTEQDYRRGYVLFERGLAEPLYADTIPEPSELRPRGLEAVALPGMSDAVAFGLLPLGDVRGIRVSASDLSGPAVLPAAGIDIRLSRAHHKTMEEGHHNHGYALMEHYLVARPELDLFAGAARRVYVDVNVPPGARPGRYTGTVTVSGPDGAEQVPLRLDVLDVPPPPRATRIVAEKGHPELDKWGFTASLDTFKEKLPPVYSMSGQGYYSHEWQEGRKIPVGHASPEVIERLRAANEDYWIADQQLFAKEQSARFTFGVWLWRTGATGRLTSVGLGNTGQRGRSAYHTLGSGNSGNVYRAVIDAATPGKHNPSRDLLLMRQGIDDARLLHALDAALKAAPDTAAARSARAFRDGLWRELDLDLNAYYRMRCASYSEDFFVKPGNPWTSAKFTATRRACAEHLQALAVK
jgi:hypothetical protein